MQTFFVSCISEVVWIVDVCGQIRGADPPILLFLSQNSNKIHEIPTQQRAREHHKLSNHLQNPEHLICF